MILRIGHLSTFYHTAVLLMARPEMLAELGVEAEWRLFGTGPAIMDAFQRGEIDLAYVGLPPAIIRIVRGVPVRCIAGGHVEGTVFCGPPGHRDSSETVALCDVLGRFVGRTIGVPGSGSIHDVILRDGLARCGMSEKISVRNFPWADLVLEAMVKKAVEAAFGTPALAVAIRRYAGGDVLFPPSLLWPYNPSYGILCSTAFLSRQEGLVERFLRAHERATALLRERPEEAAEVIARYTGVVDADFVLETIRISPKYCAALSEGYIASTMAFLPVLRRLGYISREPSHEEIFDSSLIRRIHPEEDHYSALSR